MSRLLYLFLLCFLIQTAYSQDGGDFIYPKEKNNYYHKGDTLAFDEMGHLFLSSMEYSKRYKQAKSLLKVGSVLGWTSAGSIVGGFALIALDNGPVQNCDVFCITTGQIIGILSIFIVAPLSGTAALITFFSGKSNKESLINDYNLMIDESGKVSQTPTLNLGARSGFGVTLTF